MFRVVARNPKGFYVLSVGCPSARCASSANLVCRDVDLCREQIVSVNQILPWQFCLRFVSIKLPCHG